MEFKDDIYNQCSDRYSSIYYHWKSISVCKDEIKVLVFADFLFLFLIFLGDISNSNIWLV